MKQGDLVGCSMRGGRCVEGVGSERGPVEWGSPPLTIDEPFSEMGVGSCPYSGEACGSRTIPGVHSVLVFEMRRMDGRLFFLDSDDLNRISGGIGVEGGVENVSTSGDDDVRVEGMAMGTVDVKERARIETLAVCTPRLLL